MKSSIYFCVMALGASAALGPMADSAEAQSGIGGLSVGDRPDMERMAPELFHVGEELKMTHLEFDNEPASIAFAVGKDRKFGPYALKNGTAFGVAKPPFKFVDVVAEGFSVAAPDGKTYGPFSNADGTEVALGKAVFRVVRTTPYLKVSLPASSSTRWRPSIGIAPFNRALAADLIAQRTRCVNAFNKMLVETSPVKLGNVPIVHNGITGNDSRNVVTVSSGDKWNSIWMAERSAVRGFEALFAKHFRTRPVAIEESGTVFRFAIPAGEYILMGSQKVPVSNAPALYGAKTIFWWTKFESDGQHSSSVTLTSENSVTWSNVFGMERGGGK